MSDVHAELRDLVDDITTDPGDPDRLWDTVVELGLHTIGVPESDGGSGGDFADLATVVRRLAHRGASVPVAEHAVAGWTLSQAGHPVPTTGRLALALDGVHGAGSSPSTVPWVRGAVGLVVIGPEEAVRYGDLRGRRIDVREGVNLAGEPRDGVELGDVAFATLTGGPTAAAVRNRAGLLRAVAIAGACAGAYALTRVYVGERRQFANPLIAIPAVATSLAGLKVAVLQVNAAVDRAVELHATTAGTEDLFAATAVARVVAAEAVDTVTGIAHQLHGAMGVTHEYALHPLTTRLWAWRDEDGDEESWARHVGARAAGGGEAELWERLTG
jgi:acyl-CoA dehydrogenase